MSAFSIHETTQTITLKEPTEEDFLRSMALVTTANPKFCMLFESNGKSLEVAIACESVPLRHEDKLREFTGQIWSQYLRARSRMERQAA